MYQGLFHLKGYRGGGPENLKYKEGGVQYQSKYKMGEGGFKKFSGPPTYTLLNAIALIVNSLYRSNLTPLIHSSTRRAMAEQPSSRAAKLI